MSLCLVCEKREDGLLHPTCGRVDCPGINGIDILTPLPLPDRIPEGVEQSGDLLGDIFNL